MLQTTRQSITRIPEVTPPESNIPVATAGTLAGLFRERLRRSPDAPAYRYYDPVNQIWKDSSWLEMSKEIARWQAAIMKESLNKGDRVAIMVRNSREWVMLDQAALGLGLVVVPLYTEDRADNVEYILRDADVKLLVIGGADNWSQIRERAGEFKSVKRIVSVREIHEVTDDRLVHLVDWLPSNDVPLQSNDSQPDELATIVYTSGTTGRPKGVMLSHRNILSNAWSGLRSVVVTDKEVFLSFLPLSHTLERTIGYYLPMMAGATVAYARSINELPFDLVEIKPTGLICVPRIFERVYSRVKQQLEEKPVFLRRLFGLAIETGWARYDYRQGRGERRASFILWPLLKKIVADRVTARFGGRIKIAISGGAALSPRIAKTFIGLGIPILQGYGLTEASPVVSVNRIANNVPESIGPPLPGVEVAIGKGDELLVKGDMVMLGYWNNTKATGEVIDADGWLHTGDKASMDGERIYITGRLKDIIVLANGEKVPPADMELAIATDSLFEQIMIIGESRPYLSALAILNEDYLDITQARNQFIPGQLSEKEMEKFLLDRIASKLKIFPGYAQVHRITCVSDQWTVENDLLTPTLKIKREKIKERYETEIELMYEGHMYDKTQ